VLIAAAGFSGAAESLHAEHTFTAVPGGKVVVDVSFHSVEVRVEPGAEVRAVVDLEFGGSKAAKMIEQHAPEFLEDGSTVTIRSLSKRSSWGWSRKKGRVEVVMPPGMDLLVDASSGSVTIEGDLGSGAIECDTSSGSIRVHGGARELVVDASSGSVRAELAGPVERVRADTSSGSISIHASTADLTAGASSGSIDVSGLTGSASLDTSSGSITARWSEISPGARVGADASSGSVRLYLPFGTELDGVIDTSSGRIHSDFDGEMNEERNHLRLSGGPDAVGLRVDTSSGGVRLIAE
jgi:hypothetical protein